MSTDSPPETHAASYSTAAEARHSSTRHRIRECAVVLVFLSIIVVAVARIYFTAPLWPKNFGFHDDRYLFGPNAFFLDTSLKNGEFPLWNPLIYSGTPYAAEPETTAFYPPHLLRSLLTPGYDPYATAVSLQVMLFLHVLFCGLGVYLLAREYDLSPWASIAGALAFMLGPYNIIYTTEFYIYTVAFSWGPWVLWLARRALNAEGVANTIRRSLWAALCFGISLLGMFPQMTLYLALMLTCYVALDGLFRFRRPRAGIKVKPAALVAGKGLFVLATVAVLGILIGAVVLLPAVEFGHRTARTASAGLEVAPWGQDLGVVHLLKCLVVFPGNTWWPQGCRAAGIGSLLVLLAALCAGRRRDVLVFFFLFLIMTDLTLGPPMPFGTLLRSVDFLNITVSPWRAGIFASLAFAMLVAFGVDAAAQVGARPKSGLLRTGVLVAAGVAMLVLLARWLNDEPLLNPGYLVLLLPVLTLLAMLVFTWLDRPAAARAAIGTLISMEIVVWAGAMVPAYVSTHIGGQSQEGFGEARELWQGNHRTAVTKGNWNMWTLTPATNGYGPMYLARTRQILCKPSLEKHYRIVVKEDDIQVENQRGNLFLKRSFWLARQWAAGPLPGKDQVFPAATTVFLPEFASGSQLSVPEVPRAVVEGGAVSDHVDRIVLGAGPALQGRKRKDNNNVMTLTLPPCETAFAHSVLCIEYMSSATAEISPTCLDENGRRYKMYRHRAPRTAGTPGKLFFPLPDCKTASITLQWSATPAMTFKIAEAYVLRDLSDEDAHIDILHRGANSVEVELRDLPSDRILTFIDAAYPGWYAEIDGKEAPVLLANDGFKAVAVPAGDHTVRFTFRSKPIRIGLLISGGASLFLAVVLVLLGKRGRNKQPERLVCDPQL